MTSMADNIKYLNNYLQYEELFVMKVLNRKAKTEKDWMVQQNNNTTYRNSYVCQIWWVY